MQEKGDPFVAGTLVAACLQPSPSLFVPGRHQQGCCAVPVGARGCGSDAASRSRGCDGTIQSEHVAPRRLHNVRKGKSICGTRPGSARVGHNG